jgi:ankyrin repeat protein
MNSAPDLHEIIRRLEQEVNVVAGILDFVDQLPGGPNWSTPLTGDSLLHLAVREEDVASVRSLLALGANVNSRNDWGQTPLHDSAWGDESLEIPQLLISAGADLNALDSQQRSPLFTAARRRKLKFIDKLLSAGAIADIHAFIRLGWVEVAKRLFTSTPTSTPDSLTRMLSIAIHAGSGPLTEFFLEQGASPKGDANTSPLLLAVRAATPDIEVIAGLLRSGADPREIGPKGDSAMDVIVRLIGYETMHEAQHRLILGMFQEWISAANSKQ